MTGFSANRCWLWLLLITLFRPANARIATGHHPLRKRLLDLPKGPSPLADANLLKAHPEPVTSSRVTDSRSNPIRPNHDGRPKPLQMDSILLEVEVKHGSTTGQARIRRATTRLNQYLPTQSPSVPTIQVHDKLLMNPRNDALLAPASRVVVPSYSKTSGIRHGPPIILGKDIIPEQRPPQPRHNRVSVILISKIWKKEPLSVAVLLIDQNLSQKEGQTSIHIFLDPELHKQITTWYSALFKYQAKEMSATQKMHPPNDMVFSMGKPPPSLSAPPLHHFSSQRAPQLKYQHLLKEEASSSEPRSLFKMNGIKALFGTFNRVAGVRSQFIKSLLDRGAQIYSELPKNHAFDEARKLAIMNTVKTWTTSGQNTVGQAISRLRSFIKPVPRRKPSIELQPGLYVEGLTMPENKLTLVPIPRPHRQGSPRDISQAKVSLGGVPDGEQPSAVDHFVALQNQPRQSESSHLPALRVPKVWTENQLK
ncbi:hypothetical protein H4Q26_016727 [Puccinia striiformis f. sp. tritici PST-130]|nr:hypothetical protein H4Q26_016727 [Puccinia striiformis f. sp. tritici PST-130]